MFQTPQYTNTGRRMLVEEGIGDVRGGLVRGVVVRGRPVGPDKK